jgi:hypothetical protein
MSLDAYRSVSKTPDLPMFFSVFITFDNMPAHSVTTAIARPTPTLFVPFLFMKRDQRRLPLLAFYI